MRVHGAGEQTLSTMASESPALARMDRAISELGAHAKLVSSLRADRGLSREARSAGATRTVDEIREIMSEVIGKAERPSASP